MRALSASGGRGLRGQPVHRNVSITPKKDAPGLVVRVRPGTQGERVYIPACVTHAGVDDLVYNDFLIGENAQVTIVAGCGVHSDGEEEARHNGIHRFFLKKEPRYAMRKSTLGTAGVRASAASIR